MNFEQIAKQQMPSVLAETSYWQAWARVLSAPMQSAFADYEAFENQVRYKASFNGQVVYLEHTLNDQFDPTQRRIYIDDPTPSNITPSVITNRADGQPTAIFRNVGQPGATPIFYNIQELQTRFDFVVFVPTAVRNQYEIAMRAVINFYKITGKVWTFQNI